VSDVAQARDVEDVGMQDLVQACLLRLINGTWTVQPDEVRQACPGADSRDVERAVDQLLEVALIAETSTGVELTERGRAKVHVP
jgi:hypothetical protein